MRNSIVSIYSILAFMALFNLAFPSFAFLYSTNGSTAADTETQMTFFQFLSPTGLALANGQLYVVDTGKNALYLFNGTTRVKAIIGASSNNPLTNPLRMSYTGSTLYIADGLSGKIRTYGGVGSEISTWNQDTLLQQPSGVLLDGGSAYITDMVKKKLFVYSLSTKNYERVAVESGGSDGQLEMPADIAYYKGIYYISDASKGLIFSYNSNFTFLQAIGRGKGGINLKSPRGIDIYNDRLYVADANSRSVVAFSLDGYPVDILNSTTGNTTLTSPEDVIAFDGKLYVADSENRTVQVFSINETLGDSQVAALIASAQASVNSLASLEASAAKLNITGKPSSAFSADLYSAQSYYNQSAFSSAASLAQKVLDGSALEQSSVSQAVDFKVKQIVKSAQDKIAPYRQYATGEFAGQLSQFDNKVALVNSKLSSKSYADAVDGALWLSSTSDGLAAQISKKADDDKQKAYEQNKQEIELRIIVLSGRVDKIDSDATSYRQFANTSHVKSLLDSARVSLASGDFTAANHSLEFALLEVGSYESALATTVSEIKKALDSVAVQEFELNATAGNKALLSPDLTAERKMMAQAYSLAYSNPALALSMAKQANDNATAKLRDSQTISLAVISTIVIVALIAIIGAGFYLYMKKMRKKPGL